MSRRGDLPERLGDALGEELRRLGGEAHAAAGELARLWARSVGPAVARNAWPARVARDGTLIVHTSSSAWAHELTQLEATIRERLGAAAPVRLRFVVGPLPEPGGAVERPHPPAALSASAEDEAAAAQLAAGIESQELRERVKRAAALSLAAGRTPPPDRRV